jgi:hypothetical protein
MTPKEKKEFDFVIKTAKKVLFFMICLIALMFIITLFI